MRDQHIVDYSSLISAAETICRFCDLANTLKCKLCPINLTIAKFYDNLTNEQKILVDAPWNGLMNPNDSKNFKYGE